MSIISLHLLQRIFTIRFLVGLITGILFTIIFYHPQGKLIEKHFRSDQSKFEYEKNDGQLLDENEKIVPSPLWNQSWDRFVHSFENDFQVCCFFFHLYFICIQLVFKDERI